MSYSAPGSLGGNRLAISTFGSRSCVDTRISSSSSAWPSANLAIYVPVLVDIMLTVRKLALANGATASGNFDLGLYSATGARIVSTGSTAMSGTTTEQVVDVTDTTITAGLYYLAACLDNTTAAIVRVNASAPNPQAMGVLTESLGSVTLPATATWTSDATLSYIPGIVAFLEATAA